MHLPSLHRAGAAVFGASVPAEYKHLRALRDAGLLPPGRSGRAPQPELSAVEIGRYLLGRLGTDQPARIVELAALYGGLPCLTDRLTLGGNLVGAPAEWTSVAALPAGHSAGDLLTAIVSDALAGRLDHGAALLSDVEIRAWWPLPMITVGPTGEGAVEIAAGSDYGRRLQAVALVGTYRAPWRPVDSVRDGLDQAVTAHLGEPVAAITVERSITLASIWQLVRTAEEDE